MKVNRFVRSQKIPVSIDESWEFFSKPENLSRITPPAMDFTILSGVSDNTGQMYPGMIIQYRVRPVFRIPVTWVTEITQVNRPFYFVDVQRSGPYKFWHHQHHFKEIKGGTEMRDIVSYALPFGIAGKLAGAALVKRDLNKIFSFRKAVLEERFGVMP